MAITRARKEELIAQYTDLLEKSNGFVVIEYSGLTVNDTDILRAKIREAGGSYVVTKVTLFNKALQNAGWPVSDDLLSGPIAVAFGVDNMPGVAKAVLDFTTEKERAQFAKVTGGIMTGDILDAKRVEAVSKLPTLDELRSQLAGLVVQPATGLVSIINAANGQLVNVIQAYLDDRDGEAA